MAENATLIIALSGDYGSKKEVAYTVVPAIGRRVLDLGGNVEKGDFRRRAISCACIYLKKLIAQAPTFKLIGNSLVLGSMELIAEAYTIAEKSGIGQDLVYEYIKGTDWLWCFPGPPVIRKPLSAETAFSPLGS